MARRQRQEVEQAERFLVEAGLSPEEAAAILPDKPGTGTLLNIFMPELAQRRQRRFSGALERGLEVGQGRRETEKMEFDKLAKIADLMRLQGAEEPEALYRGLLGGNYPEGFDPDLTSPTEVGLRDIRRKEAETAGQYYVPLSEREAIFRGERPGTRFRPQVTPEQARLLAGEAEDPTAALRALLPEHEGIGTFGLETREGRAARERGEFEAETPLHAARAAAEARATSGIPARRAEGEGPSYGKMLSQVGKTKLLAKIGATEGRLGRKLSDAEIGFLEGGVAAEEAAYTQEQREGQSDEAILSSLTSAGIAPQEAAKALAGLKMRAMIESGVKP